MQEEKSDTTSSSLNTGLQTKERRSKLAIYYDILYAIQQETMNEQGARPTRVQHISNMSYDRVMRYLDELVAKNLIEKGETLSITERGLKLLTDYDKIKSFIEKMGLEYLV